MIASSAPSPAGHESPTLILKLVEESLLLGGQALALSPSQGGDGWQPSDF